MSTTTPTTKWQVRWSTSKNLPYFHNSSTEESRWDPPAGMSEAEIFGLSGAKECFERQQQVAAQQQQQGGQGEEEKVRASHLLIKHAGSRRPASWKNVRAGPPVTLLTLTLTNPPTTPCTAKHNNHPANSPLHPQTTPTIPPLPPQRCGPPARVCRAGSDGE